MKGLNPTASFSKSVTYMVAARLGLETSSDAYLASYTKDDKIPEGVSLDLIAKVAIG